MLVPLNSFNHNDPGFRLTSCVKSTWDVHIPTNLFVPRQLFLDSANSVAIHRQLLQCLEAEDRVKCVELGHPGFDPFLSLVCCGSLFPGGLCVFMCLREKEILMCLLLILFSSRTSEVTSAIWGKV